MDKHSAVKLLDETFNNDFDLNKYLKFIRELFNNFQVNQKSWSVWQEYQDYIESYQLLGSYKDTSKKIIDILVVKLKKSTSRDRARTMQRNFIAKYLGNAEKDAALVAFYGDDPQDWRFSFVKMEYQLVKQEGKVKISKELTPAKRYSFLVGVNEPNHTCRSQFLKLVMEEEVNPSLVEIESAFGIEKVTKEFFEKYKELFLRLKESLEKVVKKDSKIKEEFEEKNISTVDFAKKLLGQVVFIYFLQKKGWLGVEKGENWGTGPKNFMRKLMGDKDNKPLIKYKNFFNEVLEPLFYDALANPREGDDGYHTHFKCKIPFLNGGLFEPMNDYDWIKTDIILDNKIFEDIFNTFDEFNFTVKEDEPLEKEVAVDPEMLGKVFENLLDVIDRKSKGAFYTPREIVHYMCQQSLINYLETNSDIPREDIEKFIQLGDFALDLIIKEQEQIKKYGKAYDINEKYTLPKSIKENYEKIDNLLRDIKVVDPAVGSGAFPVGMMGEIVKARSILSIYFKENRNDYDLKRETIENSLYGVDIDSSAVDITQLRFWLSLVVDELDMKNIKPLPNLDHKIICGNSLLEEFEGKKLFDEKLLGEAKRDFAEELKEISRKISKLYEDYDREDFEAELKKLERERRKIQAEAMKDKTSSQVTLSDSIQKRVKESQRKLSELKKLQRKFFNEQNRNLKREYREKIDQLEWELIEETLKEEGNEEAIEKLQEYKKNKSKPFFLWKLYFAEVFQRENPGFDVVIANPPYVRADSGPEYLEFRKKLEASGDYKTLYEKWDLMIPFIEKGINIANEKGEVIYIVSNAVCTSKYAYKLLDLIQEKYFMRSIDYFDNMVVFEAGVIPVVLHIGKVSDSVTRKLIRSEYFDNVIKRIEIPTADFKELGKDAFRKEFSPINISIKSIRLGDICYMSKGMVINADEKKAQGAFAKDDLISKTPTEIHSRTYIEGKDIDSYILKRKKFLEWGTPRVPAQLSRPTFPELYDRPKIMRGRVTGGIYDEEKLVCNDSIVILMKFVDLKGINNKSIQTSIKKFNNFSREKLESISQRFNLKYILALLNSSFAFRYLNNIRRHRLKNYFYPDDFRKLPIADISLKDQKPFIQLVDQILSITKDEDYLDNPDKQAKVKRLEKEIDQLVYRLYDLTSDEIKIVEEFNNG